MERRARLGPIACSPPLATNHRPLWTATAEKGRGSCGRYLSQPTRTACPPPPPTAQQPNTDFRSPLAFVISINSVPCQSFPRTQQNTKVTGFSIFHPLATAHRSPAHPSSITALNLSLYFPPSNQHPQLVPCDCSLFAAPKLATMKVTFKVCPAPSLLPHHYHHQGHDGIAPYHSFNLELILIILTVFQDLKQQKFTLDVEPTDLVRPHPHFRLRDDPPRLPCDVRPRKLTR